MTGRQTSGKKKEKKQVNCSGNKGIGKGLRALFM